MNDQADGEEPSTSYTFGPKAEGRIHRLREKLGEDGKPVETAVVFSAALRLLEATVDKAAEGRASIVEPKAGGEIRLYAINRRDLEEAFRLWEEENGGDDVSD